MINTQTDITTEELNDLIVDAIQDIKGKGVIKMNLSKLDGAPAEYFIVCEGDSSTQVRAIAQNVQKRVKETFGLMPNHSEGKDNGQWVLVDYFQVVVHVFYPEAREFYDLEDLWSDAEFTEYQNL